MMHACTRGEFEGPADARGVKGTPLPGLVCFGGEAARSTSWPLKRGCCMSLGEPPSGERHRPPVAEYMAASGQASVPRVEERRPTIVRSQTRRGTTKNNRIRPKHYVSRYVCKIN